jgi:Asp-tRNA(Asn)/Glu-tRNA(Gln) amidotransferase A subunit family amidase
VLDRRTFLELFSLVPAAGRRSPPLAATSQTAPTLTTAAIAEAEKVAAVAFTPAERDLLLDGVAENVQRYEALRSLPLTNDVPPAFVFDPLPPGASPPATKPRQTVRRTDETLPAVSDPEQLAFLPVTTLGAMLRQRRVTSLDLTRMYLSRLKRYDRDLECVVTVCEALALEQAARADREIAAGQHRGPLHGIPWGAKDLLAVKDYPTTWGAEPYRTQTFPYNATVVERLEAAGAVLIAKLSLGETARGDVWYGGRTRNPWNLEQGASGSSAGPAAATAAGLVAFSIGTDTRGSIVLPADRCGVTGFRPTFGTVSRHGAMVLAWTMDKIGPMCRTVEDCALVYDAIRGPDGRDASVRNTAFDWNPDQTIRGLRVGIVESLFERDYPARPFDRAALGVLRELGATLVPVQMPDFPVQALRLIMDAETAAAFDNLTRTNADDRLVDQGKNARPNNLRHARFIPAVEYLQACRARTLLMQRMAEIMNGVDVVAAPSLSDPVLMLTNLTGHPCVVVPNGFTERGSPVSISFIGGLYRDADTLVLAQAYQQATAFHTRHPARFVR